MSITASREIIIIFFISDFIDFIIFQLLFFHFKSTNTRIIIKCDGIYRNKVELSVNAQLSIKMNL